jgi:imidazolonepropionase-like amidohydrolase
MGTTTAKLNFKITGTTTTTTTGTFNGVVTTTGSGLFKNDTVTGSITLGKGLKPTSQGGACSVTKQLGSMPITAITLNIT